MQLEWLKPVVGRLERLFSSVKKYAVMIKNAAECYTKGISVFNLKNVDMECKETFALLLSRMFYEKKKYDSTCVSFHLIIDEAHNILNSFKSTHSDVWEDYRLTTFESMIKEGRKYGFFLTIASQRPADISPTIMSQIHNYIIHKLVNDKDLQMLENTMPTLDAFSKSRIPTLGKGEAVLTGRAFGMPSLIKVDYEEYSRPDSDDVDLVEAWSKKPEVSK
ncbi:ATP-binding protein [Bifidobacterium catenulatum]|uniref:ATP-binding protein n=1 Tax=Bifidobacterium catenulatum TaxID=1686 RepID=A0AAW5ZYL5_9BIFI|nr:ATP-binding protein [Bifidobacterium catenulatum]MDB1161597.1 ATP-binding protein [Bifidobacterium catenulatum]